MFKHRKTKEFFSIMTKSWIFPFDIKIVSRNSRCKCSTVSDFSLFTYEINKYLITKKKNNEHIFQNNGPFR